MITIARIDERLIHGQVAYSWTTSYKSDAVMVVDAEAAADQFQTSLLKMACPTGMKCFVVGAEKAVELLHKYPSRKFFLVAKGPAAFLEMVRIGYELRSINVGGLYHQEGRRQVSKTVYVDGELEGAFRELAERGVSLEVRTHPSDNAENLIDLL